MTDTSAWASTRTDAVRVQADDSGRPVAIHIASDEVRYGGEQLAQTILDLTRRATDIARARRREELERDGMDPAVLDRMGFPRADDVARAENDALEHDPGPTSWLRSV